MDLEHLSYTHGYHDVDPAGWTIEGAYLKSCFNFKVAKRIVGLDIVSHISTVTHVHGLGYSFVEIHQEPVGMDARLWVLVTPVDGSLIEMVLVSQVHEIRKPGRLITGLGFLPVRLRHRLMNVFVLSEEKRYVAQDVVIWERKRYRTPPRLSQTDGPIGKYRRYCQQFYPENPGGTGRQAPQGR